MLAEHFDLGRRTLHSDGSPEFLFCDNETNTERLWGLGGRSQFPKDAINDHVVHGAATVNPEHQGTKAAFWHHLSIGPGQTAVVRLRLSSDGKTGAGFDDVMATREREANQFYAELTPDVVVMDLGMPGMGGLEALRRIRARNPAARVLALSAHDDPMHARRALRDNPSS